VIKGGASPAKGLLKTLVIILERVVAPGERLENCPFFVLDEKKAPPALTSEA